MATEQLQQLCISNYAECLYAVEDKLVQDNLTQIDYFTLKMYELNSLFYLGKYKRLGLVLKGLQNVERLPKVLELKVHIYSAKLAVLNKEDAARDFHLAAAQSMFEKMMINEQNPYLIIDYANLHLYLHRYQAGIDILKALESKFAKNKNNSVKGRIVSNLGNFYARLDQWDNAQKEFYAAREFYKQAGLTSLYQTAYYNYGRSFQETQKYAEALDVFQGLLPLVLVFPESDLLALTYFRLGQLHVALGNWQMAKNMLDQVDIEDTFSTYSNQINALMATITKNLQDN